MSGRHRDLGPGNRFAVLAARIRIPLVVAGAVLLLLSVTVEPRVWPVAAVLLAVGYLLYLRLGTVRTAPVPVRPPVAGRWVPVNSPGSKVPSHGLHAYGQTYAIDLVHVPEGRWTLELGWSPLSRPARDFPAYGQPVLAPADATVVRVRQRMRDHRSRTSWPAFAYVVLEGFVRELSGPGRVVGNHVVLQLEDGTYALLAHLRQHSVTLAPGQRVTAGEQLAECGNSGNTSEPHVHFQLMDRRQVWLAAGLPFTFTGISVEAVEEGQPAPTEPVAVPANLQPFTAEPVGVREGGGSAATT